MSDGAASIGLNSREISASADAVRAELEAGHPVICSVRPGDFTTTGHFIVLAGLAENGQVTVRDPNSEQNSTHPWDLERILAQCANCGFQPLDRRGGTHLPRPQSGRTGPAAERATLWTRCDFSSTATSL